MRDLFEFWHLYRITKEMYKIFQIITDYTYELHKLWERVNMQRMREEKFLLRTNLVLR